LQPPAPFVPICGSDACVLRASDTQCADHEVQAQVNAAGNLMVRVVPANVGSIADANRLNQISRTIRRIPRWKIFFILPEVTHDRRTTLTCSATTCIVPNCKDHVPISHSVGTYFKNGGTALAIWCANASLTIILKKNVRSIFTQMINCVRQLHFYDITHNDLHLSNFVFNGSIVRLIDFDKSLLSDENQTSVPMGKRTSAMHAGITAGWLLETADVQWTKIMDKLVDVSMVVQSIYLFCAQVKSRINFELKYNAEALSTNPERYAMLVNREEMYSGFIKALLSKFSGLHVAGGDVVLFSMTRMSIRETPVDRIMQNMMQDYDHGLLHLKESLGITTALNKLSLDNVPMLAVAPD